MLEEEEEEEEEEARWDFEQLSVFLFPFIDVKCSGGCGGDVTVIYPHGITSTFKVAEIGGCCYCQISSSRRH